MSEARPLLNDDARALRSSRWRAAAAVSTATLLVVGATATFARAPAASARASSAPRFAAAEVANDDDRGAKWGNDLDDPIWNGPDDDGPRPSPPHAAAAELAAAAAADAVYDDYLSGIDDFNHSACGQFEARNDSSTCHDVDSWWCDGVRAALSADERRLLAWYGCDSCDGHWGPCLLMRIGEAQSWCDRLARNESLWALEATKRLGRRLATSAARAELSARRLAGGDGADDIAAEVTVAPVPAPTPEPTYATDDGTECDAKAYCEECAPSSTCSVLVAEAHAARIDGVEQDGQWGEVWHAGQAFDMLMSLHYVCMFAREQGIIAPPRSTSRNFTHTSGGRHPVN